MTDFYSRDRSKAFDELKEELYARLESVRELLSVPSNDEWDEGFDDRLLSEQAWLRELLDKIERS